MLGFFFLYVLGMGGHAAAAQSRPGRPPAELVERMKATQEGFAELLAAYQQQLGAQSAELARRKKLYQDGRVEAAYVRAAERDMAETQAHILEVQQWIFEDDLALTEALMRDEIARAPALPSGGYAETQTLIRYNGQAKWSLADAGKIQKFFLGRFGRALPVSAMGQTAAHDRLRFDHHDAMDVALYPDSAEGRVLMDYLRETGIPFMAFRGKIAGAATGAHIHIGKPSLRLAAPR